MNIREAILKAADHIERNPRMFNFDEVVVPGNCGTPGCALGWIGHFSGVRPTDLQIWAFVNRDVCKPILGMPAGTFYDRMDELHGQTTWRHSAAECAFALRLYADKYHPAEVQPIAEDRQLVPWAQCAWKPATLGAPR